MNGANAITCIHVHVYSPAPLYQGNKALYALSLDGQFLKFDRPISATNLKGNMGEPHACAGKDSANEEEILL